MSNLSAVAYPLNPKVISTPMMPLFLYFDHVYFLPDFDYQERERILTKQMLNELCESIETGREGACKICN